ncbi:hypothetical protein CC1G_03459 [Coprinopsis cinerea okayama7|uniref:Uncharacterized protein n=1 Tax=Coprinopsis cinerea (strain Okayama-7 / 130 / ATCC MYA-4618 / FGSC 9003) TaxID=240176 RepID=A8NQT4_COPC7|nr:hypothetical protein CC1G_03459 [Coprinopsis cinerea okayama7\|eukprot:XP_001835677.1 hypothetical protein CC1G_03459 [Coprinopsis cinerea okayama7\
MAETLLAFKAGRAFRREGTKFVDADATKGAIILSNGEDGLLHFIWKNRITNEVADDLILFPGDATFSKVTESNGRVWVLKFESSGSRHFFWMQDADSSRDQEFADNVNRLLEDPESELSWNVNIQSTSGSQSTAAPAAGSSSGAGSQYPPDQLATLAAILRGGGSGGNDAAAAAEDEAFALTDVLTPTNLAPLFNNHPELIPTLFPHLPSDLPVPPSAEALQRVVNSTQFKAAAASLDRALRTGLLGGFVRQLGLPEEAGLGLGPFLRAIQEQADHENRDSGNRMDTD